MEKLTIFDEKHREIGTMSRKEVHETGHWHETFHCWLLNGDAVYIQRRSNEKESFPGLFDCTAAGHLLAGESVEEGTREVEEELGLEVTMDDLKEIGIVQDEITSQTWKDREFTHVYVYECELRQSEVKLQKEEVEGLYLFNRKKLADLFLKHERQIAGFRFGTGERVVISLDHFVPHDANYFQFVANMLKDPDVVTS